MFNRGSPPKRNFSNIPLKNEASRNIFPDVLNFFEF